MSRILLGVSASAAIHKACDVASKLAQEGHAVRAVLTRRAAELVAPQLFEALTGERAYQDEFGPRRESAMDHIALARWAELTLVAPASADLVGRLAHGLADDLLTTLALALDPGVPRLLCPAMNPVMLASPPVRRNLVALETDGWRILSPGSGHMACGEAGPGRLMEPADIAARVREVLHP